MSALRDALRRRVAGRAGRWLERVGPREPAVAILLYHRIVDRRDEDPFSLAVSRERFEEQMRWLSGRYRVMRVAEAVEAVEAGTLPERRVVAITFDDGYRDNLTHALPVLSALGLPATLFVATGYAGTGRPFWWDRLRFGSAGDLDLGAFVSLQGKRPLERDREIGERIEREPRLDRDALPLDAGEIARLGATFDIGGHGHDHVSLGRTDAETAREDLASCAKALPRLAAEPIRILAFPFGAPEDATPAAAAAAEEAGFAGGLTTRSGVARRGADRWSLPRVWVHDVPASHLATTLARAFGDIPVSLSVLRPRSRN